MANFVEDLDGIPQSEAASGGSGDLGHLEKLVGRLESMAVSLAGLSLSGRGEAMGEMLDRIEKQEIRIFAAIEKLAAVFSSLEKRVAEIEARQAGPEKELLEACARRTSRVDAKIDNDVKTVLETIARRVSRIEGKVDALGGKGQG